MSNFLFNFTVSKTSLNTSYIFICLVAQIAPHTETCIPSHTCHWQILQHVCNHHMPTKREASCLQQQTVSASDTHTAGCTSLRLYLLHITKPCNTHRHLKQPTLTKDELNFMACLLCFLLF